MPIVRTPLVDDDGSGTTGTILNNAWWTTHYNAIDAAGASAATAFTPADASGAALAFALAQGLYVTIGPVVIAAFNLVYPTTSNGSQAFVSLPVVGGSLIYGGFTTYTDVGSPITPYMPTAGGKVGFATFVGGVQTNANLTGHTLHFTVVYFK